MTVAPKERGVLFNGPMVRAIFDDRKTRTRRPVTERHYTVIDGAKLRRDTADCRPVLKDGVWCLYLRDFNYRVAELKSPLGQPGDRLWVRETWQQIQRNPEDPSQLATVDVPMRGAGGLIYAATYKREEPPRWRPSIHMPRWASRLTLEITDVRVERVQDIGKDGRRAHDVLAEGMDPEAIRDHERWHHPDDAPAIVFGTLWNSLYGPNAWYENGWVWVYDFARTAARGRADRGRVNT